MAVGVGVCRNAGRYGAGRAFAVFNDDLLTEHRRQLDAYAARHDIGRGAGRVRHQNADRFDGKRLRLRASSHQ